MGKNSSFCVYKNFNICLLCVCMSVFYSPSSIYRLYFLVLFSRVLNFSTYTYSNTYVIMIRKYSEMQRSLLSRRDPLVLSIWSRKMASGGKMKRSNYGSDLTESGRKTDDKFTFFFGAESSFSQWHHATFTVDGFEYNCAEQYMMHQKAGKKI